MSNPPSTSSIKTDIFEFCQDFAGILKPFSKTLESVRSGIKDTRDVAALQRPLAAFSDVHHRLESLINKVAEQQAYVIIFGPLKSGKSTLMNAISAAYVSEVTSLPAYPCLVHVKHGEDYSFVATRYSGEKLRFADNAALQTLIEESHETLATRLREIEEIGEKFDPGVHYPDAIRRVDVVVPTRNLRDSLTVMVDTPGLYTRMKFGYDLMTREFRNSAACAVFVVKTDNLFLEQVFEEFNQLLDLFSRIFLVVNIDTNKRDLNADGSLRPSLESRSPGEVIRAFESLVMSAPLRRAKEEGRLQIYPIDLLSSAAEALKGATEVPPEVSAAIATQLAEAETAAAPTEEAEECATTTEAAPDLPPLEIEPMPAEPNLAEGPPVQWSMPTFTTPQPVSPSPQAEEESAPEEEPPAAEIAEIAEIAEVEPADAVLPASWAAHPEASFSLFLKDLTAYLNSSEYLQEFMGDALLMGSNLGLEIQDHCSPGATENFEACQNVLQAELADTEARLAAVEKLAALDIQASFAPIRQESQKFAEEVSKAASAEALQTSVKHLDQWFTQDHSLAALQAQWATALGSCGKRVGTECHNKLRSMVASPLGGIQIPDGLRSSIVGLDELLGPVVAAAREKLANTEPSPQSPPFKIDQEHLKIRKSLWDWLAFRSAAAMRRRLFGQAGEMNQPVPAQLKEKRLGAEGKQALKEIITAELSKQFPGEASRLSVSLLDQYIESLTTELGNQLQAGKEKYASRQAELSRRIEDHLAIRKTLENLTEDASGLLAEIGRLRGRYQSYSRVNSAAADLANAAMLDEDDTEMEDFAFACGTEDSEEATEADDCCGIAPEAVPEPETDAPIEPAEVADESPAADESEVESDRRD
jgi:energy-coupling factor transporter ATP-binding protein EcfA2